MTDAAKRGRASRAKGARAERQVAALIADLTGWTIKRRVRNHAGDSDLEGVPGWCVEVKDRASPTLGDVRAWWAQTVEQTTQGSLPVLFYKRQPGEWRAVWPSMLALGVWHEHHDWTHEGSIAAWASAALEMVPATQVSPEPEKRAVEAVDASEAACLS